MDARTQLASGWRTLAGANTLRTNHNRGGLIAGIEGVPVYDAIGGSLGFRQPGYTVSIEPGISWSGPKNSFSLLAPVAVYRIRERSTPEILLGRPGGDASFADFSILASFTHRF